MFTTLSTYSPWFQESSSGVVIPITFSIIIKIMLIILNRSQVCSSSSEHKAWLGLASYPRSRQHSRLTICRWFGWIWQIVWDNNIQISNLILRRGALSTNVLRQRRWWSFCHHCVEIHIVHGCHYKLNDSSDGWFAWPLPWIQSHIR